MRKIYFLLLTVLFAATTNAQIGITVTNPTNTTPNLASSYTSLANALAALNATTAMSGPVTFTLAAGASETAPPTGLTIGSATLNPVLSAVNTITIVKAAGSATVLNAGVGTSTPGSAAPDGILKLTGADYITIDGLTFTDGNVTNPATMEFGVGLFKLSAGDGCNNNTIQNCIFNMQNINNAAATSPMLDGAVAIEMVNSTATAATTQLTPTNGGTLATNGTNSGNKFYANTINGGNIGIGFGGYAAAAGVGPAPVATTFLGDLGNDIGGVAAPTGNTILNFGGAAAATNPAAGIRANNQWSANIQYNNINNNNGSGANHLTTLRGIYGQAGTSANVTISNNTITLKSSGTTSVSTAIENVIGSTAAANTVTITGNIIQNCTYTTATTATFTGILAAASAANQNVNNNQVINNTIGTLGTGSSCIFQGIYASASSTTFTANSNTISNNTLANNFGTMYCIRASTSTLTYDGNTISNNTIPNNTGATSSSIYGFYDASSPVTETYTNNNINNLNITGSSTATGNIIYGMYILTASGVKTISGNNINNLNFTSSSTGYAGINGIRDAYASTGNIFKNVVHSLSSTGATPTIQGIIFGTSVGTTYNVYDNIVGNITAPQSTGFNIMGIYGGSAGTTYNVSYNTVYLAGTSSGSGSGSAAMYMSSTTPTTNLIDNIFVNLCTPTGAGISSALRRTSTVLTAYGTTSNNNLFYAGNPTANNLLYYDATNSYQTMSAFKAAVTPRETNSFSETVSSTPGVFFQSLTGPASGSPTTFLHLVNGLTTQCESGGIPVAGITDDYDGNTRNVATPDVGADEFTGTLPPSMTFVSSTTTQNNVSSVFTNTSNQEVIGIQVVTAGLLNPLSVTNFTLNTNGTTNLANIANAKIFYTGNSSTFAASSQFGATVAVPSGSYSIAGSQTLASGTNYFWLAYDVVCGSTPGNVIDGECNSITVVSPQTPTVQAPPGNRSIVTGPLSGTYTVGSGGDYATLTAAAADLNTRGMGGNCTFSILNSLAEAGAVTINQWAECGGSGFTLTIKPAAGTSPTVSTSIAGAFIILNGADRVTIDGSNNGTTSRDMTISNTITSTPTVINMVSLGVGLGATNNTIKNCNISTGLSTSTGYGISVGAAPGVGGADNDNNTIQNNNITVATVGIYANGTTAVSAGGDDNLLISGNTITNSTTLQTQGIQVGNALTSSVTGNTLSIQTSGSLQPVGISLEAGFLSSSVTNNIITKVLTTATGGYGGRGITIGTGSAASNVTIANNSISGVNGSNWSAFSNSSSIGIGIGVTGSGALTTTTGGVNLYHNSVNMYGNYAIGAAALTAALYVGTGVTTLNMRNNVFVNSLNNTTQASTSYAIYDAGTNAVFSTINYNDYFTSGAQGVLGFLTANQATIAAWRTASGQDLNSISADPLYNSNTNLRPGIGSPLVAAGVTGTGILTDLLGTVRGNPPTIGAYEVAGEFAPPVITYTPLASTLCIANRTISATITDASGVNVAAGTKPRVYFKKSTNANALPGTNDNTTDGWKYTEATNASSPFNLVIDYSLVFGGVAAGDVIQYFVIAQDLAAIPNVGINSGTFAATPASVALTAAAFPIGGPINSYTNSTGGISSNVTIGAAGTYTSLTGATGLFAAINAGGLNANITASILDASVTETGAVALNNISYGCGGPFTLTIKPAAGNTATLTGSLASTGLIRIFSSNVIIDGSNNGTTSRDLTITNTNVTAPSVIWMGSVGATPITNVTVKNSIIINGASVATAVVLSDGTTLGSAGNFNNITIQNNSISNAYIGSYSIANPVAGNGSGLLVTGNDLNTSGATQNRLVGVYVQGADGATVSNNNIGNMANTLDASNLTGIWLATGTVNSTISGNTISNISGSATAPRGIAMSPAVAAVNDILTGNTITNLSSATTQNPMGIYVFSTTSGVTVQKNVISNIKNSNATSTGSYGINLASTLTPANVSVVNNMIFDIASVGSATSTANGNGIIVTSGSGYNIYYNTVNLNTEQTSATGIPAAINITSGVTLAGAIDLRDNIFTTSQTIGTDRYAIYSGAANTVFSFIDFNDYFSAGPNLGFIGSNRANLAAIQAGFGGNLNSKNILPVFMTITDMHLNSGYNPTLNNQGTNIAGITTDIDGDVRNAVTPDMGADEFNPCTPPTFATASSNSPICAGSTLNLFGSTDGTSFAWTGPNGFSSALQNPTIPNATVAASGIYSFQSFLAGCPSLASTTTVVVNTVPVFTVSATPPTICLGASSQLAATITIPAYCQATYTSGTGSGDYITNVTLGTINNTTGASASPYYTYYSALNTNLTAGSPYTITGTINNGGTEYVAVWIDYNQNGVFEASEKIGEQASLSFSIPFTVPAGTFNGVTRLRVVNVYNTPGILPCGAYTFGETEDYNVTINGGTTPYTYLWSPSGTLNNATISNPVATPVSTTIYNVTVTGSNGCSALGTTTVTVNVPPTVSNPSNATVCSGATATFTVIATGNPAPTYQWQLSTTGAGGPWNNISNGAPYSGVTTATLTVSPTTVSMNNYQYRCVVTGSCVPSTATSLGGILTVNPIPDAIATPSSQTICSASTITTIVLSGSVGGTVFNWTRDNTVAVTGIAASGAGNISGSLTNTTNAPVTVTFTITPTAAGCVGTPITATVLVNPTPNAVATPSSQTICSAGAITTIVLSGNVAGTVFNWTRDNTVSVTGIAANGAGDISGSLTNTTNAPVTVTFTITPTANGCPGAAITATVLVNPTPNAVATPSSQTICSGGTITTIVLSGNVAGTVFNWTRDNTVAVTGIAASGSGDISGALTNTTAAPVTVTFTITPTANGCPGTPITATVLVNPLPVLSGVITQPTTCVSADGAIDLTVSGTPGPYTYFWTTNGGSGIVQGVQDQSGLTVGQYTVLVTDQTTGCQQTAVFNLTGPGGCAICPTIGSVTTNPTPGACAGSTVTLTASGLTSMGITYGITFKYSLVALADPYVGGTVIGTVANGSLGGGGTTATLNTSFPVSGNYIIYAILTPTPIDPFCRPSAQVNLIVNPNPVVNPVTSQTYCNGTVVPTGTFNFSSPTTAFGGKILIAYADIGGPPTQLRNNLLALPGVTQVDLFDASAGTPSLAQMQQYSIVVPFSNNPYADPVALGNNLADYVDANGIVVGLGFTFYISPYGPTGRWVTGNYSPYTATSNLDFNPHTLGSFTAGHPLMTGVTVLTSNFHNIVPVAAGATQVAQWDNGESLIAFKGRVVGITAYIGSSATWSGDFAKVIVNAGNWLGGGTLVFNWTNNNVTIGLGASGTGTSLPTFTATNAGTAPVTATISVTASYTNAGVTCTGPATTFTITVNPTPNTVATPSSQTICSGSAITTIVLTGNVAGTVFNWTRDNTVAVTGIAASGAGNISGSLTNTTLAPVTVTFTITPTANGCSGTPVTATVLVNPTPNAVATPASQTVCSALPITTIVLSGSVAGTTFNWTRNNTATATGIAASGTGNISGTLTNITNAPVTVTFTITPTANGCAGAAITATVLVNPTPNVSAAPSSQTICSGSAITPIVLSSTTTGGDAFVNGGFETGTFAPWVILGSNPVPVVNGTAPHTGTKAAFLGNLPGPEPLGDASIYQQITVPVSGGTLSYWYQPFTTDGITFDWQDAYITNTSGTILATIMHVCNTSAYTQVNFNMAPYAGQTVRVEFLVHQDGFGDVTNMYVDDVTLLTPAVITYNWTRDNNATVTGIAASGSGTPITGTLTNTTFAPVTVTFTITPTSNGCIGTPATATVLVNPTPNAIATPSSQTICSGTAITPIVLTSSVTGTTYAWTRNNTATVTGIAASGTGNISGTLTNTTTAPVTVTFTITPTANGCAGPPITATVIVQAPLLITCPGNITVPSIVGGCTAIVTYAPVVTGTPAPTFTYTLTGATTGSGSGTGSGLAFNVGVTTVTITATNICSTVSCSFTITVTDSQLPVVTTPPANTTVCVGSSATFSVVATNTLSYQWQAWNGSTWNNIAGATASTLTLNGVTFSMNTNSYRVIVTGLCSSVASNFATLYVNQLPTVSILASRPPVLLPTQTLTLTAVVSPGGGSYQWYKNGVAIVGATGSTLSGLTVDDVGTYTVRYTDVNGCVQTSAGMTVSSATSGNIYLYPNPNTGHFQVRFNNAPNEKVTVNIYDEKGSLVYRQAAVTTISYTSIQIDISNLPSSTYVVTVIGEDGRLIGARRVVVGR